MLEYVNDEKTKKFWIDFWRRAIRFGRENFPEARDDANRTPFVRGIVLRLDPPPDIEEKRAVTRAVLANAFLRPRGSGRNGELTPEEEEAFHREAERRHPGAYDWDALKPRTGKKRSLSERMAEIAEEESRKYGSLVEGFMHDFPRFEHFLPLLEIQVKRTVYVHVLAEGFWERPQIKAAIDQLPYNFCVSEKRKIRGKSPLLHATSVFFFQVKDRLAFGLDWEYVDEEEIGDRLVPGRGRVVSLPGDVPRLSV